MRDARVGQKAGRKLSFMAVHILGDQDIRAISFGAHGELLHRHRTTEPKQAASARTFGLPALI
jgi:hypothetical protein